MNRIVKVLLVLIFSFAGLANATTVTGTITDPDGTVWANGNVTFTLTGNAGASYSCAGTPMTPAQLTVNAVMNGSGAFSTTLCANNTITPVNTQWAVQISSATTAPPQNLNPFTTSGGSQDISTVLNPQIVAPRIAVVFGTKAYNDTEILSPTAGTQYYNLTSNLPKIYNGSTWSFLPAASGPVGHILLYDATATTAAEIDVVTRNAQGQSGPIFQADYDYYECTINNFTVSANGQFHFLQFSTNGGSSYDTTSVYGWGAVWISLHVSAAPVNQGNVSAGIPLFLNSAGNVGVSNLNAPPFSAILRFNNPFSTQVATVEGTGVTEGSDSGTYSFVLAGYQNTAVARNAFRILPNTGTVNGTVRCYGYTK